MLGSLIAFAPLSIDMYLPGLPAIAHEFAASAGTVQYTLAAYFVGMAVGQLLYGPLADRYGRKPPLYAGLALYVAASVACALAGDVQALVGWRFVQALGGCASVVVPLAVVADRFDRVGSAKAMSRLMLVMGVAPILAPVLGSMVVVHGGWRAIFGLLAGAGALALLAATVVLPETLPAARRLPIGVGTALKRYAGLLAQRDFLGFALVGGCAGAGLFAYIAGSAFVFIEVHGLSAPQYAAVFGFNALGLIAASQVNHALLGRWRPGQLLRAGLVGMAAFGMAGWACHAAGLVALLVPIFGFLVAFGFVSPNASSAAMAAQREGGGSASALLGTLQFALGAVAGATVGALSDGSAHAMTAVMAIAALAALASWRFVLRPAMRA